MAKYQSYMRKQNPDDYLCNNRQCRACVYGAAFTRDGGECTYLAKVEHSRGCEIPFCERFELKKGKRRPTNLTKRDFKRWFKAYGSEDEQNEAKA